MSTSPFSPVRRTAYIGLAAIVLTSCLDAPDPITGTDLATARFVVTTGNQGVHPNQDVLANPYNPFRYSGLGEETKWELLTYANRSAAFYGWATLLAQNPRGELQFYTAQLAHTMWTNNEARPEDMDTLRDIAVRGYQAVLDYFPDGLTFDPTGTTAFRLSTLAYQGIVALGEVPTGGWVLVTTEAGTPVAIQLPREDRANAAQ